ncbi:hypothetical protein [Maricaulis sp.]|uniref:hypothetical protein n=1 Tax=Maricaulis sp. TaxID=1486257 RepID=UPI0025B85703|nr:hypothetical protein [Maricaulis sp.]
MTSDRAGNGRNEVRIHAEAGFAEFVWRGEINRDTLMDAYDRAAAHLEWRPYFNRLSVFEVDMSVGDVDFDAVREIRQAVDDWQAQHAPGERIYAANLVLSPFAEVLASVWAALPRDSDRLCVQVFRTRPAALEWLDSVRRAPPAA